MLIFRGLCFGIFLNEMLRFLKGVKIWTGLEEWKISGEANY